MISRPVCRRWSRTIPLFAVPIVLWAGWPAAARQHESGADGAAGVTRAGGAARPEEAVRALGESPVAALFDVLGPDAKAFNAHVITLSNPFFEGRAPGSRGNVLAAEYIESYFKLFELRPAFDTEVTAADGTPVITRGASFRQQFSMGSELTVDRQSLSVGGRDLKEGTDFTVLGYSGDGKVSAPIVFVGYSLKRGMDGYVSYPDGTDLTGRIALVLRFEPMTEAGKSRWASDGWSPSAALEAKISAAAARGAAAVILVNPPGADDPRATTLATTRDTNGDGQKKVPVLMMSTDRAEELVRAADPQGRSLMDLRVMADAAGAVIDLPGATVAIETRLTRTPILTENVGAVLPGRGSLRDQYLIIGAHFDHVGFGPAGAQPTNYGKLHPGADDNASGTSGLLVLADKLARAYLELPEGASARSIMFVAFSGEESGLIGSRHFVRNPPIKPEQMYLMVNMDMIGRLRNDQLEVGGVGTAAGLREWLAPYFDRSGLAIKATSSGFGPSDHASFAAAKVPVLFFFTLLHREYHTPADVGSTINQMGAAKVIGLAFDIVSGLATRTEPLSVAAGGPAAPPDQPVGQVRSGVRFGIAPGDYSGSEPGVLIGDVYEGTSAAEAGLKVNDLMTTWTGTKMESVEAWMPLLAALAPGDVVEVGFLRDGKPMTAKVTLKARDQGGR